jgi:hypothetical protein
MSVLKVWHLVMVVNALTHLEAIKYVSMKLEGSIGQVIITFIYNYFSVSAQKEQSLTQQTNAKTSTNV